MRTSKPRRSLHARVAHSRPALGSITARREQNSVPSASGSFELSLSKASLVGMRRRLEPRLGVWTFSIVMTACYVDEVGMIGAIAGDVIGSVHEHSQPMGKDFELFVPGSRFTDDSVMTIAVASAIRNQDDYARTLQSWGRRYPHAGYGGFFRKWLASEDRKPYYSFGNGSAMRASPVGWAFDDLEAVLREARRSAEVTHDHPEGIKGAEAVAGAVFLGRTTHDKTKIKALFCERFGYECSTTLDELRRNSVFDVTCQGTVPAAAIAFLESTDFEDAVRNAVSLGGDADTLACIAGCIAEAHYGQTPDEIQVEVLRRLDESLLAETLAFAIKFGVPVCPEVARRT